MRCTLVALVVGVLALAGATTLSAAPVVPTFTTFGPLPQATFGGAGIPNNAVAITSFADGNNTITLGMTAHGRFANPAVTNNGAGVFFATPGANFGDPTGNTTPSSLLGATWNFAFYANIAGGGTLANYDLRLLYDFNPAAGNDAATHGVLNIDNAIVALGGNPSTVSLVQDSQNLLFGFLAAPSSFITPPGGSFDPNALGQYTFALQIFNNSGTLLGQSAILVNVTPEPASLAVWSILGAAGAVYGWRRRRCA